MGGENVEHNLPTPSLPYQTLPPRKIDHDKRKTCNDSQNFLIKKNLAKEATAQAVGELRGKQKSEEKAHAEMIAEAKAIKAKLEAEETVVEFVEKVGPDGRTFGSITNKKIAEELQKQFGIKIDKRNIQVQAPIRAVGLIDVPVKIYQDVTSVINLRVKEG